MLPKTAGAVAGKWRSCSNPQILKMTTKPLGQQISFARPQYRPAGGSREKHETKTGSQVQPQEAFKSLSGITNNFYN